MAPPTSSDPHQPGTLTDENRARTTGASSGRWAALADTLEAGLFRQLHMLQGASRRWETRRSQGVSDQNILDALEYEWGLGCGASGSSFRQTYGIGGANPRFWFGCTPHDPPTLQGKALAGKIRQLLKLPPRREPLRDSRWSRGERQPGSDYVEQGSLFAYPTPKDGSGHR